jgi:hypothetical protein
MASRVSNDGTTDIDSSSTIDLPPRIIDVTLADGTSISLHGTKWDGVDHELLDVELPPPFCAHLLKSPVFFTGTFTGLAAAFNELTRNRAAPLTNTTVQSPIFPVNSYSADADFAPDKYEYEQHVFETEDEDIPEADHVSCDESSDEDYDDTHTEGIALDFEFA